jgi:hypothetical protein
MTDLTLDELDRDGVLSEGFARLKGSSRAELLRGALVGGGALALALAAPQAADAKWTDTDILNFALSLEYLQADFYTEVERMDVLKGGLAQQAKVVGAHERAHVKAFKEVLGSKAIKKPRYDFRGATESPAAFRRTAVAFEDLAVAAYKGQAPNISKRSYLVPALAIHAVEARHAAWIRRLAGVSPVLGAFDEAASRKQVLGIVADTEFQVKTTSRSTRSPRFTG